MQGFIRRAAVVVFLALGFVGVASAQGYPIKSIKWIVPYPPAGTTDVLARIVAQSLSDALGQQVVVENKPGGGNNIGTEFVVNAPADGYTMLLVNPANGINASLYKKLSFNFIRDIAPVAGLVRTPNVMVVTNGLPVKTVAEFIAYCKANPSKVNMASSSSGTSTHLSGELFKSMTGCNMVHIPYKGAGPVLTDLIGGQVQVFFDNEPSISPFVKAGRVKALAVTGKRRSANLPDIATMEELGYKGFVIEPWFAIGAPAGTPEAVIRRLNDAFNRGLQDPIVRKTLLDAGITPAGGNAAVLAQHIRAEHDKWAELIRAQKITAD